MLNAVHTTRNIMWSYSVFSRVGRRGRRKAGRYASSAHLFIQVAGDLRMRGIFWLQVPGYIDSLHRYSTVTIGSMAPSDAPALSLSSLSSSVPVPTSMARSNSWRCDPRGRMIVDKYHKKKGQIPLFLTLSLVCRASCCARP